MKKLRFLIFLLTAVTAYAQQPGSAGAGGKWKIVVPVFENRTPRGEQQALQTMIHKSLLSIAGEIDYLEPEEDSRTMGSVSEALRIALYNEGWDIALGGYYYVESDVLYVSITALDLVTGLVKFQQVYRGVVGLDIFDTLDEIAGNMKEDLRKTVRPPEADEIVRYRNRTVYVTEGLGIRRSFSIRYGMINSMTGTAYLGTLFPQVFGAFDMNLKLFGQYWNIGFQLLYPFSFGETKPLIDGATFTQKEYQQISWYFRIYAGLYVGQSVKILAGTFYSIVFAEKQFDTQGLVPQYDVVYNNWKPWIGAGWAISRKFQLNAGFGIVWGKYDTQWSWDGASLYEWANYDYFGISPSVGADIYFTDNFGVSLEAVYTYCYTTGLNNYPEGSSPAPQARVTLDNILAVVSLSYRLDLN